MVYPSAFVFDAQPAYIQAGFYKIYVSESRQAANCTSP